MNLDEIIDILTCPVCGSDLILKENIECIGCGLSFPVIEGIPVLLADMNDEKIAEMHSEDKAASYRKSKWLASSSSMRKAERMAITLQKEMNIKNNSLILDVGCGPCTVPSFFSVVTKYIGVDFSLVALRNAYKLGLLVNGDAEQLPFKDRCFDGVVSFNTMEHVPDTEKFISENVRVCKRGGMIGAVVPNSGADILRKLSGKRTKKIKHVHHHFNEKYLISLFQRNGLYDIHVKYRFFIPVERMEHFLKEHKGIDKLFSTKLSYFEEILESMPVIKKHAGSIFIVGKVR